MDAGRVCHVFIDHFGDAEGGGQKIEAKPCADIARDGCPGLFGRQGYGTTGEIVGVDLAKDKIRIGDRGAVPTALIAGGAGFGTGAFRAGLDAAKGIDPGDGAATCADLDHLDHGDGDGHARSLAETVGARDFEAAGGLGLKSFDQADLGGGSAHVIADDLFEFEALGHVGGEDRPACRAGFHKAHREFGGGFHRDQPAAGMDHEDRAARAQRPEPRLQATKVIGHLGADIGIGADGVEPFEFAHLGRNVGGKGNRQIHGGGDDVARAAFVIGIDVGMDEPDGDSAIIAFGDLLGHLA